MNFGKIDRYILLGGGRILVLFARYLREQGREVVVFTSPRHESQRVGEEGTLGGFLRQSEINFFVCEDIGADRTLPGLIPGAVGVSFGAAWVFKKEFIDLFGGRLLNLHGTRLPQYRGGGHPTWAVLRGNRLGYSVLHQVTPGIDAGDVLAVREYFYPSSCRLPKDFMAVSLEQDLGFLKEIDGKVQAGEEFSQASQPEYLSMYWPRLNTQRQGFINWEWKAEEIESFICGFDEPFAGASTFLNGKRIFLKSCFADRQDGSFHPFQSGLIYRISGGAVFVAANNGTIVIRRALNEDGESVLESFRLGDRLMTPREDLEAALAYRPVYTPSGLKGDR